MQMRLNRSRFTFSIVISTDPCHFRGELWIWLSTAQCHINDDNICCQRWYLWEMIWLVEMIWLYDCEEQIRDFIQQQTQRFGCFRLWYDEDGHRHDVSICHDAHHVWSDQISLFHRVQNVHPSLLNDSNDLIDIWLHMIFL